MNLLEQIRKLLRSSLSPGAVMPDDDVDLMPLMDRDDFDAEEFFDGLADLAKKRGLRTKAFAPHHHPETSPSRVARLRLLAPVWPRAAAALAAIEDRREIVTITGLAASIEAGAWQSVGSAVTRYDPEGLKQLRRLATVVLFAPAGYAAMFAAIDYWFGGGRCAACPDSFAAGFLQFLPVSYAFGFAFAVLVVASAIWTVLCSPVVSFSKPTR